MQDQKIKFWFAERKKVSKTRISNRAARKGQFYKPHQLNLYYEVIFTWLQNCQIWEVLICQTHSVKTSYTPKLQTCALPSPKWKRKNSRQWTCILYSTFDLSVSSVQCECTKQVHFHQAHGRSGASQFTMSKKLVKHCSDVAVCFRSKPL